MNGPSIRIWIVLLLVGVILSCVRADAQELAVASAAGGPDKTVSGLHRENECVGNVLPIGPPEDEGLEILPHVFVDRVAVAVHVAVSPTFGFGSRNAVLVVRSNGPRTTP